MLVGTDRAKHRRGPVSLDRLKLPHRPGPKPRVEVPDQEKIGGAAASAKKVLPGGVIGVGNARIQDPRLHVEAGGGDVERHNGAAVAVGRGVGVQVWEAKAGKIGERKWGADEVSSLVKALDPLKSRCSIRPCDDEAAVRKGGHVAEVLGALLIEEVDENVTLHDVAIGIIDRRADGNAAAAHITEIIRPSHDKAAVGQSSNVRVALIKKARIVSADYGRRRNDVVPGVVLDRQKDVAKTGVANLKHGDEVAVCQGCQVGIVGKN